MKKTKNPEDVPKLFAEYWNQRRPDLMAALFEEDADFINVVGLWWNNRQDIFKAHDYGLKVIFKDSTLSITKLKTKMLSEKSAVVHTKMKLEGQTGISGEKGGLRHTVFSFIVRKDTEGSWWAVSAQNTDIVSGVETYIRTRDGSLKPVDYRKK
ncbi:MAG: SgcJ/EcaC family oxidoreductase [Chitinophagales bacterium]|nr:SgcJ/EcaC family oxidoreductase [Chitinophagales bacterium]